MAAFTLLDLATLRVLVTMYWPVTARKPVIHVYGPYRYHEAVRERAALLRSDFTGVLRVSMCKILPAHGTPRETGATYLMEILTAQGEGVDQ